MFTGSLAGKFNITYLFTAKFISFVCSLFTIKKI